MDYVSGLKKIVIIPILSYSCIGSESERIGEYREGFVTSGRVSMLHSSAPLLWKTWFLSFLFFFFFNLLLLDYFVAYYRGAMGILLVYDVTDESSFNSISPFLLLFFLTLISTWWFSTKVCLIALFLHGKCPKCPNPIFSCINFLSKQFPWCNSFDWFSHFRGFQKSPPSQVFVFGEF